MNEVEQLRSKLAEALAVQKARESQPASAKPEKQFFEKLATGSFKRHVADLEQQLYVAEAEARRELVEWHLEGPRVRHGSVPLRLLARLSEAWNSAMTQGAWRLRNATDIWRIPDSFYDLLDLRLADVQSGSARLMFTGNTAPDLAGSSLLADTLSHTFSLLKSDSKGITEPVAALGLRSTHKMADWLKALQADGVAAELRWHDDQQVPHEWGALPTDMARVRDRMAAMKESQRIPETLDGEVVGLFDTGRIQVKAGNKRVTVRYPRKLYAHAQGLHLGEHTTLPVWHSTLTNQDTGKTLDRYALRDENSAG